MRYTRIPYSADCEFEEVSMMFGGGTLRVPKLEYPVSVKENFLRAAKRNDPLWVPNSLTDIINVGSNELAKAPEGAVQFSPWGSQERAIFIDDFGCNWTYVPEAGGPMLTPGIKPVVSDITKWEQQVKWPDRTGYDYESAQKTFNEKYGKIDKVLHLNIGQSCTERLVALMGGYTEALVAMAEEPDAVSDFLNAFADFTSREFLRLTQNAKVDFVTFHDDWGTERDTFFSPGMMEEMVFEPTKKIIDTIKSTGAVFELHSCGKIERFVPYMIDMGIDFIQIQRRANDIPALKQKYGDRIGFNTGIEGIERGVPTPPFEEYAEKIRNTLDLYADKGGFYTSVFADTDKDRWDLTQELFCSSREFYEK